MTRSVTFGVIRPLVPYSVNSRRQTRLRTFLRKMLQDAKEFEQKKGEDE